MTKVGLIKFLILFFVCSAAFGQKVKYKDIFGLLSTKQYEQAEPFLKKYLIENTDNPNAFLFMGMIYQEKASKADVLKQTRECIAFMDSAIIFYDKAFKTIDEREVRKNKEYYQAYNRRDLRTGEFGVKLSDIQFDVEKKIEGLRERIDRVKMVKHYFTLTDSLYKKSNALYKSMQDSYASERQLFLRADETTVKNMSDLAVRFDSVIRSFDNYKSSANFLGKTGYNQTLTLVEINEFKSDGGSPADFFQDEVKVWDYKKYANKAKEVIEKEIFPMRNDLITYDIEINKLRERLNTDSLSVRSDLTKLIDKLLFDKLKKFDPEPLPMEVFSMKTADLEYRSALLENRTLNDSADVHFRLNLINTEFSFLNKLDSIASKLSGEDLEQKARDYNHFITNTYSNTIVLNSYIKALKEYAEREKRVKNVELTKRLEALNWLVDEKDSIPLKTDVTRMKFKPLFTADEKYTIGLNFKDSVKAEGYFFNITPSRKPGLKVKFPVDHVSFTTAKVPVTKALSYSDPSGQVYYILVYGEQAVKEKYPATLAKIYTSDGLAWSNNYPLAFVPTEISFKAETGELTVKNDSQQIVVDKNGKLIR
jgi:hypothetical protein